MKKIRPLALLALFLCAVVVLSSCGFAGKKNSEIKALSFKDVVKKSTAEEPAAAQIEKLTLEGTVTQTSYPFVVLSKDGVNKTVYNLEQNKVVFTATTVALLDTTAFGFHDLDGYTAYFWVQVTDNTEATARYQTTLYDASGNSIATVDRIAAPNRTFDLVSFGGKIYRLGDESATATLTEVTGYSALSGDIPNIGAATADYYYQFNFGGGNNVHVYDKNLKLVSVYNVEGNPVNVSRMILDNGNVVFQAFYQLPDDASDFDFSSGTDKYKMKTVIVTAKDGKAKEISFGYMLLYGSSFSVDDGNGLDEDDGSLSAKIRSIAGIYPIVDGVLMSGATDTMFVAVDNNMKILGRFDAMYDNQAPLTLIDNIYPSYFTVDLANGGTLLIDAKGKEIGDISGNDAITYSYIYAGGKMYNYKLEVVYDYEAAGYDLEETFERSAIFSKDNAGTDEYFIYLNGALTALDTKDDKLDFYGASNGVYLIKDTTDLLNPVIRYYNEKGELLLTQKGAVPSLTPVLDNNTDTALFSEVDPDTTQLVYYRLTY